MLTTEQRHIAEAVLKGLLHEQVQTVGGYGGTGKTTVLGHLARKLSEFAVAAFTGNTVPLCESRSGPIHPKTVASKDVSQNRRLGEKIRIN